MMCPLLGGGHETNDPIADIPVLAFGQGGAGTNHEQHPIGHNNSTINRLIIRMKKPNNDEYPRERVHIYLVIFTNNKGDMADCTYPDLTQLKNKDAFRLATINTRLASLTDRIERDR